MATTTRNERVCAHTLKRQVILTHHVHMANVTICAKDHLSGSLACKRCRGCCWSTRGTLVGHFLSSSLTQLTLTRPKRVIKVLTSLLSSLSAMLSVARLSHDFDRC